ncbi:MULTISPECIES: LysE family translocator [unclassified Acidovorax]|uniref:LysE family translocator n=1 Tax=unclassified Acidovorax TaxID=2684926 RepID=UPI00288308C7|nr:MULTISPECIES: LysE family translocator [unclassified Acidovorax]
MTAALGLDAHQLLLFIAAGWLLNLTPGPDVFYIVTHALRSGARAGIVAGLGIAAGCCVHVVAAALGVGALLAASATAFTVLKWLGAAYLLWMGVRMLRSQPGTGLAAVARDARSATAAATPLRQVFLGGFWTNVLNPKVALFFLAFVPQFIAPGAEHKTLAFLLLGLLFTVNALPVCAAWALGAAWVARRVGALQQHMHWLDRAAGALFIAFGIKLALTDPPTQ